MRFNDQHRRAAQGGRVHHSDLCRRITAHGSRGRWYQVDLRSGRENRRHERVNQILEEEIERLQSSTAKRTGRAYLSVIEGGTASFAPLRAEA